MFNWTLIDELIPCGGIRIEDNLLVTTTATATSHGHTFPTDGSGPPPNLTGFGIASPCDIHGVVPGVPVSIRTSLTCLSLAACLLGQGTEHLTLEGLAHPTLKQTYAGMPTPQMEWLPDGDLAVPAGGDQVTLLRVDSATWESKPLLEGGRIQTALVAVGVPEADARTVLGRGAFIWNDQHGAFLVEVGNLTFVVDVKAAHTRRFEVGKPEEPCFSPDGTQVAYLRGNDLFRTEVATGRRPGSPPAGARPCSTDAWTGSTRRRSMAGAEDRGPTGGPRIPGTSPT